MFQFPISKRTTLPSVEGGFGSMNILRDPPKAIHTRYIPKVGDTSRITEWIDGSGDRVCEMIQHYARGVNPMVSVDYSNNGTNGGQMSSRAGGYGTDQATMSTIGQAYLPYRVARDGAFRPPVQAPEELLPLSRLPRLTTSESTNPGSQLLYGMADSRTAAQCSTDLKALRQQLLNVCAPSRSTFNIERPQDAPYEIKNMVSTPVHATVHTTAQSVGPTLQPENYLPSSGTKPHVGYSTQTNPFEMRGTSIETFIGNQPIATQNTLNVSCESARTGNNKVEYIHEQPELRRNMPMTNAYTNIQRAGDINYELNSRNYTNLPERRPRGGFVNGGMIQSFERQNIPVSCGYNTPSLMKNANEQQYGRFELS